MLNLVWLALIAASAACGLGADVPLEVLTEDTIDERLKEHDLWIVSFVVEWCQHCSRLKPQLAAVPEWIGEELSRDSLQSDEGIESDGSSEVDDTTAAAEAAVVSEAKRLSVPPPVMVGVIECTHATVLCDRFNVMAFPTTKLFKAGNVVDTLPSNARRTSDIISVVARLLQPSFHRLKSVVNFKALNQVHQYGGFLLIFPEGTDVASQRIPEALTRAATERHIVHMFFASIADSPELTANLGFRFAQSQSATALEASVHGITTRSLSEYCPHLPCVVRVGAPEALPTRDDSATASAGGGSVIGPVELDIVEDGLRSLVIDEEDENSDSLQDAISIFIDDNSFGLVTELYWSNFLDLKDAGRQLVALAADLGSPTAAEELLTFRSAARKMRQKFYFGRLDGKTTYREALKTYNIDPDDLPVPVVFEKGMTAELYFGPWLNISDVAAGLELLLAGGIEAARPSPFELPMQKIARLVRKHIRKLSVVDKRLAIAFLTTALAAIAGLAVVGANDLLKRFWKEDEASVEELSNDVHSDTSLSPREPRSPAEKKEE